MFYNENFYVITGGPGAGKTTLLKELHKEQYPVVPEIAREIIQEEIAQEGNSLPWKDKESYTDLMLERSVKSYIDVFNKAFEIPVFFDRGIIDSICYAQMIGLDISEKMKLYVKQFVYNQYVFILPPWREIYLTDTERKQDWEEAKATYIKMEEAYKQFGYKMIEVPKDTVEKRKEFVLNKIKKTPKPL